MQHWANTVDRVVDIVCRNQNLTSLKRNISLLLSIIAGDVNHQHCFTLLAYLVELGSRPNQVLDHIVVSVIIAQVAHQRIQAINPVNLVHQKCLILNANWLHEYFHDFQQGCICVFHIFETGPPQHIFILRVDLHYIFTSTDQCFEQLNVYWLSENCSFQGSVSLFIDLL